MQLFDSYVLFIIILLPVVGAALFMAMPSEWEGRIRWVASAFGLVAMLLTFYVFLSYYLDPGGYQFERTWNWLEIPGPWAFGDLGISLTLGVDGIAAPMILLTGVVMFTGVLVSWNIKSWNKDFFILYFLLLAGVFGVFASMDLFFFFFFYELSVLPMYLLIGVWGSSSDFGTFKRPKEYGAMKLMLFLVAGSVLIWVGIMAVFVEAGLGTFDIRALAGVDYSRNFQIIFFPFLALGFGILAGLWPFHTWSPDGHVAAPTAVSMVHAGVLMKLGAFGIIRIAMFILPEGAQFWMPVLIGLGTVNVIYGAISAMGQSDLKYVIGYSSVSHMGYVIMGIATLNPLGMGGAVLQMFSHGIMTALFFTVVGVIYSRTHTRDIMVLDGLAKRMGVTAVFFAIAGLASLGLPGLSGFVAELLVFLGLFQTYPILGVLGVIGAAITAIYILRLMAKVFFGPISERWEDQTDMGKLDVASAAILAGFVLLVGLFPFPFMKVINTGVSELLTRFTNI
ncbi:MAG: NADH-quinone oxidoreductase subunit M [Chloroflexi bacterium]|nr:NADH-quinone oxidoreductase subunit M [Chloroflexota bacterium]MDA1228333.1 NADH-quinone oxidoreductase subunit M [Chloroflexota bacterium]